MKVPKIVWEDKESKPLNKKYLGLGSCGLAIITFLFPVIMAALLFIIGIALIIMDENKQKGGGLLDENRAPPANAA